MKLDSKIKKEVYEKGLDGIVPKIEGAFYRYAEFGEVESQYGGFNYEGALYLYREMTKTPHGALLYNAASQIAKNVRMKKERLKKRIVSIMSSDSWFLTLTFDNDILCSTSFETRKKYIKNYLRSISNNYVANVDYGSKNGREHYHAVIQAPIETFKTRNEDSWDYGFIKCELIGNVPGGIEEDEKVHSERLAKYITKLSNHALKDTNDTKTVIYSRK